MNSYLSKKQFKLIRSNANTYNLFSDDSPQKAPGSILLIRLFRRSLLKIKGNKLFTCEHCNKHFGTLHLTTIQRTTITKVM